MGRNELNKLTLLPMCGFIAQLVEHRTGIAEVMGSNPVEALIFFRLLLSSCLRKIYCDDHTSLFRNNYHDKTTHTVKTSRFVCRICSTDATFNTCAAQLTTYLLKRGYNRNFVTKQIRRAFDIPRRLTLQAKDVNKPKRIPFITTFNPSLPHISNIIKIHYNLLFSSNRCKKVFQHLPVVAFRRSLNLRDLLVTAKISSNSANPQLPSGSFRCGKNCSTR